MGNNLLNSSDEYAQDNIKIYYKKDGVFEYVFQGNLDHPNMHYIDSTQTGELILIVFANNNYEGDFSETIIELNENTRDTMRCEFDLSNGNEICTNVWINGEEMGSRNFELIK